MARRAGTPTARLRIIEYDRIQIFERRIEQRELTTLDAGQKDQAACLIFHQTAQHSALVERKLVVFYTHVSEKYYIVFGECLERARELLDVILITAADFVEARVKQ